MRQSQLFTKTRKEAPKDEVSKNAQLLIRGGFVHKEMAGVYDYLPLGLRVLKKIEQIIREEMDAIGGQETFMTTLQSDALWKQVGKWDDEKIDVWFKTKLQNGTELGLAWSHEEVFADMLKHHISSYNDLPKYIYQFQNKFRNELRSKSGIMRGREFLMKDMYSFSQTNEGLYDFYEKVKVAYAKIFERVGLGEHTYLTFSDGSPFSEISHEFQTLSEAGEDTIYLDEKKKIAINEEVYTDKVVKNLGLDKDSLVKKKSIEVGNIFPIESNVSDSLGFTFTDENGGQRPVIMGSYGIGLGRLMGTVAEVFADDKGLVWPESISPFKIHLLKLGEDTEVRSQADKIYNELIENGMEVLYDDREVSAGEKFADADLIGISHRVVVSSKTIDKESVEIKARNSERTQIIEIGKIKDHLHNNTKPN